MLPPTLQWLPEKVVLRLIDQRHIPQELSFVDCRTYQDVAAAIEEMTVRGAPAIGVAAAYGIALAARESLDLIPDAIERLAATRPTAVNLFWALERMRRLYTALPDRCTAALLEAEAVKIHEEDIAINRALSAHGEKLLPQRAVVITHCNAGALATAGYGTALGVFRAAREAGKELKIFADETRPRLQGGRITAFELFEDGFNVTVICDAMSAFLMKTEKIDAVITGADRVAANGDTANKIGTYALALAARYHDIPFYIAAPLSTIDRNCPNAAAIPIELRDGDEIRTVGGSRVIAEAIKIWNPAFDVTPASLISAIITEAGVLTPPFDEKIKRLFNSESGGTSYEK